MFCPIICIVYRIHRSFPLIQTLIIFFPVDTTQNEEDDNNEENQNEEDNKNAETTSGITLNFTCFNRFKCSI